MNILKNIVITAIILVVLSSCKTAVTKDDTDINISISTLIENNSLLDSIYETGLLSEDVSRCLEETFGKLKQEQIKNLTASDIQRVVAQC